MIARDLNSAAEQYFVNPPKTNSKAPKKVAKPKAFSGEGEVKEAYAKYICKDSNRIEEGNPDMDVDGVSAFFEDLGIEAEDPVTLVIFCHMNAQEAGELTQAEFVKGLVELECPNVDALRSKLPELRSELEDPTRFKQIYTYAFELLLSGGAKNISGEMAVPYLDLLLPIRFKGYYSAQHAKIIDFLRDKQEKGEFGSMKKDEWVCLYEFIEQTNGANMENFNPDEAFWPILIDQLGEHLKGL